MYVYIDIEDLRFMYWSDVYMTSSFSFEKTDKFEA
jgi:hypothetical protein